MKKKLISIVLIAVMMFSFVACQDNSAKKDKDSGKAKEASATKVKEDKKEEKAEEKAEEKSEEKAEEKAEETTEKADDKEAKKEDAKEEKQDDKKEEVKEDKKEEKEDKKAEDPVKISIFIPGYTDPTYQKAYDVRLDAFKEAHPEIEVEVIGEARGEFQKLFNMIQVGEAPDVMIMGSRRLTQIYNMGELTELDEYVSEDRIKEYVESVYNTGKVNGKQVGLPMAFSSRALYYRTDLIKEPPTTWEELIEVSKQVQKDNPDMKGFAIPAGQSDATIAQVFNFIYQNGGKATDDSGKLILNSPEIIEAVQFYVDLYTKHEIVPNPVELHRSDLNGLFKNGQIAMFISGPWEKNTMQLEMDNPNIPYATALLPKGKEMAATLVTDSVTISSKCENKDAAWTFVEFFTRPEYQNKFDEIIGFFPVFKSETTEERYKNDFLSPFIEMIEYGNPEPKPVVWEEYEELVAKALQQAMLGEKTVEEALNEAQENLDKSTAK